METNRTSIEIEQTMKRTKEQKYMAMKILGTMVYGKKC